jgi:hypothetical protein
MISLTTSLSIVLEPWNALCTHIILVYLTTSWKTGSEKVYGITSQYDDETT